MGVSGGGRGWAYTHGCVSVGGCAPTNMGVDGCGMMCAWMGARVLMGVHP